MTIQSISVVDLLQTKTIDYKQPLEQLVCSVETDNLDSGFVCVTDYKQAHYHRYMHRQDAPVLVLLHPLGGNCTNWLHIIEGLRQDYTIYAVDLPAHGLTTYRIDSDHAERYVRWFSELMDYWQLPAAHLVGYSFGGRVAAVVAAASPARVQSLTLFSPALKPANNGWAGIEAWSIEKTAEHSPDPLLRISIRVILEEMLSSAASEANKIDLKYATETFLIDQKRQSYHGVTDGLRWLYDEQDHHIDWLLLAASIPVETLFGDNDKYCPLNTSGLQGIDQLHVSSVADVGHLLPLERPHECVAAIRRASTI